MSSTRRYTFLKFNLKIIDGSIRGGKPLCYLEVLITNFSLDVLVFTGYEIFMINTVVTFKTYL